MRILVLAPHPFFQARGTPLAVRSVLEFLSARGHAVDVLTFAEGEDVTVSLGFKDVLAGLPRGLFKEVPALPYDTEAKAFIEPHGHLLEVGVDVAGMWSKLPKAQRAALDARVGWWAMTMKEATDGSSIAPPGHVFDPAVTPPSQCKK